MLSFLKKNKQTPQYDVLKRAESVNANTREIQESILQQKCELDQRIYEIQRGQIIGQTPYLEEPETLTKLFAMQRLSRYLVKSVPEGMAFIRNMVAYAIGSNPAWSVDGDDLQKEFLKTLVRVNKLNSLAVNAYTRYLKDGEVFIELKPNGEVPRLSIVLPERFRAPSDVGETPEWRYGIRTDADDWSIIKQYCIYGRNSTEYRLVNPKYIFHLHNNPGHKRGYPVLVSASGELSDVGPLREAGRRGEAARCSIAFIRQHAMASDSDLQDFSSIVRGNAECGSVNTTRGMPPTSIIEAGSIVDVPEGLDAIDPPATKAPTSHDIQLQATTHAISAATGVPDWAISGRPFSGSYASSLTAESPFVKTLEFEQGLIINYFKDVLGASFAIGSSNGLTDNANKELVELTLPRPQARDMKAETDAMAVLHNQGVLSKQTWAAVAGFDYDEEQSNINTEDNAVDIRTGDEPDEV